MRYALIAVAAALIVGFGLIQLKNSSGTQLKANELFPWVPMQDASTAAQNQNKKVFIYVYTDWCSWCRKMEGEVFTDARVAEILTGAFIPVALNAESDAKVVFQGEEMSEKNLAQIFGLRGFPTILFLSASSEPITVAPGFIPADRLVDVLAFIGEDYYKNMEWNEFLSKRNGSK